MSSLTQNLSQRDIEFLKFQKSKGVDAKVAMQKLSELKASQPSQKEPFYKQEQFQPKEKGAIQKGLEGVGQSYKKLAGRGVSGAKAIHGMAKSGAQFGSSGVEDMMSAVSGNKAYDPRTGKSRPAPRGFGERAGQFGQGAAKLISGATETAFSPIAGVIGAFTPEITKAFETVGNTLTPEKKKELGLLFDELSNSVTPQEKDALRALTDMFGLQAVKAAKPAFKQAGKTATGVIDEVPAAIAGAKEFATDVGVAGRELGQKTLEKTQEVVGAGLQATKQKVSNLKLPGKSSEKLIEEATGAYREILRPTKGEVKKVEIRGGKNIDEFYELAAKEELPIGTTPDKKLDTLEAREKLKFKQDEIHTDLNNSLASNTKKQFELEDIRVKAKEELRKITKNDTDYKKIVKEIDEFIDDAIDARGGKLNGEELNNFKQGMWSMAFNQMQPTANTTARRIGHIAKEMIEGGYPEAAIKELNEMSGKYATLNNLLENAQGRVIEGGRLGKHFAQIAGSIAGVPIPVIGPIGGAVVGGKVAEVLANPARKAASASKKARKAAIKAKIEAKNATKLEKLAAESNLSAKDLALKTARDKRAKIKAKIGSKK